MPNFKQIKLKIKNKGRSLKKHISGWSAYAKNKWINGLIFFFSLFIIMGTNYCFIFGAFLPKFFLLDLLLILLAVCPIFFFRKTIFDAIWMSIILFLVTLLACVNVNYYKFFNITISIKDLDILLHNLNQAVTRVNQLNWTNIGINIGLYLLILSGIIIFNAKFCFVDSQNKKTRSRKSIMKFASIFTASTLVAYEFSMGMWVIAEKNKSVDSIKYVNYHPNYHFKNLGMINYYNREIRQLLFDKSLSDESISAYLKQSTKVNDAYTGFLNGNQGRPNVFVIMIETGDRVMANPYTTPTLWKLFKQQGLYGEHNYSWNHTNVSNIIGITGNYPTNAFSQRREYAIPFSLPRILKDYGYDSRFYYDIVKSQDSYNDMWFMNQLGFENCLYHNELIPEIEPWEYVKDNYTRDTVVVDGIIKNLKTLDTSKKIYAQWMTMHMHMDNIYTDKNKELIDSLYADYGSKLKLLEQQGQWNNPFTDSKARQKYEIYTLKTMDFDAALEKLQNYFYNSDDPNLNNTLLVAYGDHAWFETVNGEYIIKPLKQIKEKNNIKLYSTILGLYHPSLVTKVNEDTTGLFYEHDINKMTSPACIYPTILDLLGLPFNPMLCQEKSIFDLNGKTAYDNKELIEVYYTSWLKISMNENYTSEDGCSITSTFDDNDTQNEFVTRLRQKQTQLRILQNIYLNDFFNRNEYKKYLP